MGSSLILPINVAESDESNNSGRGQQVDLDDVTYFPWDKDGNGVVSPRETLTTIFDIGSTNAASDFDGDGRVTPLEALSVLQRIGYRRNDEVFEAAALAAPLETPHHLHRVLAAPNNEDELTLFPADIAESEHREILSGDKDDPIRDVEFSSDVNWLSVI